MSFSKAKYSNLYHYSRFIVLLYSCIWEKFISEEMKVKSILLSPYLVCIKIRSRYFAVMNDLWVNNKRWLDKSAKL